MTGRGLVLRPRPGDDRGTSLVLALIFVTVGSLVLMAVLALAETNVGATLVMNDHASDTAAAEGAANIAINFLRGGEFAGLGSCLPGGNPLQLNAFYTRPDGKTKDSAVVTCDLDSKIAPFGTPSRALLTLDPTATSGTNPPVGITVSNGLSLSVGSLRVQGDVFSNSNIYVQPKVGVTGGNLTSSGGGTIKAIRACSASSLFSPAPLCGSGTPISDPLAPYAPKPADLAGLPDRTVPGCAPTVTFQQGHYGSRTNPGAALAAATALSALTSSSCLSGNAVLLFQPGIYYFEFAAPDFLPPIPWTLTAGTVIGGALRPGVTPGPTMPVPNSCVSPVPTPGSTSVTVLPNDGVTFVFSGGSWMNVMSSARVELCGRYGGIGPPLAIYAEQTTGALGGACTSSGWPCAAVLTGTILGAFMPAAFQVEGTIYLPNRELVLNVPNNSTQAIRGGVEVRRFWANTSRATTMTTPVIETPVEVNSQRRTVVWLKVFLCPASPTCTASGQPALRTRVSIVDPTGLPKAGNRQMTVLSWGMQG
jgi:hypothetical protein